MYQAAVPARLDMRCSGSTQKGDWPNTSTAVMLRMRTQSCSFRRSADGPCLFDCGWPQSLLEENGQPSKHGVALLVALQFLPHSQIAQGQPGDVRWCF